MSKRARQGAILRLIEESPISTQSEMAAALADRGFEVTQTTISRDLAELGLVKVRNQTGSLVYATRGATDVDQLEAMSIAMQRWVLDIASSGNLVVLRTPNGYADPVSQAIDESGHPDIIGTIAGENTVLVIAGDHASGSSVARALNELIQRRARSN